MPTDTPKRRPTIKLGQPIPANINGEPGEVRFFNKEAAEAYGYEVAPPAAPPISHKRAEQAIGHLLHGVQCPFPPAEHPVDTLLAYVSQQETRERALREALKRVTDVLIATDYGTCTDAENCASSLCATAREVLAQARAALAQTEEK